MAHHVPNISFFVVVETGAANRERVEFEAEEWTLLLWERLVSGLAVIHTRWTDHLY